MSEFKSAWSLFGNAFLVACEETGRAIAESTHEGFAYLAEKTKPAERNEDAVQSVPNTNTIPASK